MDREDSSKRKSSTKRVYAVSIGKETTIKEKEKEEEEEEHKGKLQHIVTIMRGAPHKNAHPKGTMERKIAELMVINKKGGTTSTNGSERSIISFSDSEKVKEILNDIFPLVIIVTISQFNVY